MNGKPGWANRRLLQRGFSIVELLVAMILFGIVAAIAIPSFQVLSASADLRSTSSDLVTAITTARTQAVTLRVSVELAPQAGGWSEGWILTYDWPTGAVEIEDDVRVTKSGRVTIDGPNSPVTFQPGGIVTNGAVDFELCRDGASREINITPLGRVTVQGGTC